jgi:diacylglycerol kinase family enzyme
MRYGIAVNPAAGQLGTNKKRTLITRFTRLLGGSCEIVGWDTRDARELQQAASEIAPGVDILIVAGGDGTFSDIMNAVEPDTVLSYLPLGSGNAWRKTLGLPLSVAGIAERIRNGQRHAIDLILCDGCRKGIFASIGIEGHVLHQRATLLQQGVRGFDAYFRSTVKSLLWGYKRNDAIVEIDGRQYEVPGAITVVVTKTRFYGYAFEIVPQARPDDGLLHVLTVSAGRLRLIYEILTSFIGANRTGTHRTGEHVRIATRQQTYLQIDGTLQREGSSFEFQVLPRALLIHC